MRSAYSYARRKAYRQFKKNCYQQQRRNVYRNNNTQRESNPVDVVLGLIVLLGIFIFIAYIF